MTDMRPAIWNKIVHVLAIALALSSCTSTGILQAVSPDAPISGSVTRGFLEPHRVEVTLDGKAYRGEWRTTPAPDHPQANSTLHKRHVGKVQATLRADDGAQLVCTWLVHGYAGEGSCTAPDKREYTMRVR